VQQVKDALQGAELDAIFIDGDHTAYGVMCDYALYEELVGPGGVIMFGAITTRTQNIRQNCGDSIVHDKGDYSREPAACLAWQDLRSTNVYFCVGSNP
jgi:predicted O-methyltransferase YrrM